jgi:flagellar basal body-associated protein FliL
MADQDNEIIDQNDIDKLLEASSTEIEDSNDIEDIGELSQDDIDALMDGGGMETPFTEAPLEDEDEDYEYELDLISQDDINQIVSKKKEESLNLEDQSDQAAPAEQITDQPEVSEEVNGAEAPVEADTVEEETVAEVAAVEPAVVESELVREETAQEETIALEDGVIDESEAVSAEECLVTQENIDRLLTEAAEAPIPQETFEEEQILEQGVEEAHVEEQAQEDSLMQDQVVQEEPLEQETSLAEEPVSEEDFSQQEITTDQEAAMEEKQEIMEDPESDSMIVDLDDDDDLTKELDSMENEELQGDVDSLLDDSEEDAGDDWEQDSLISQDDIEDLIKSSENEDEDALGDLDSSDDEDEFGEDDLGDDELEDDEEDDDAKVILEESEGSPDENIEGKPEKKQKKKKKRSIKISKKFVIMAASVVVLAGALSLVWFFVLNKDKKPVPGQRKIVEENVIVKDPVVESVDIIVDNNSSKPKISKPMPSYSKTEPLVMKGFVVLAPETIEGLSYIQADISIDYYTDNAYHEIKNNMPFYRDIVYSAVQKALGSTKGDKITESDLLVIVQKALKEAMPERSIKQVSFKSFKAG